MKKVFYFFSAALLVGAALPFVPAMQTESVTLVVTHEVKDFATLKNAFGTQETARAKTGLKTVGISQAVDNAKIVTVISEAPSAEAAKKFNSSPNLKEAMEKAGVVSKPEIKVLHRSK